MDPVHDQVWNALVTPVIQAVLPWVPLLILGLVLWVGVLIARDMFVAWADRKLDEIGRFIGEIIRYIFGFSRVSDEAIQRARGSRSRR